MTPRLPGRRVRTSLLTAGLIALLAACATPDPAPSDSPAARAEGTVTPDSTPSRARPAPPTSVPSTPTRTAPTRSAEAATAALLRAVRADDPAAAASAIADGADLERRDRNGRTPLVAATKANRVEPARVLLAAGADPDAKDDLQDSAFLYAGAEGLNEILRLSLEHGADETSTNRYGGTALIPASEHGHVETVRILIEAGVPVDHVNDLSWTALHEAIVLGDGSRDQVAVVRLLLAAGADPTIPDGDGVLPRRLAADRGFTAIVEAIDRAS